MFYLTLPMYKKVLRRFKKEGITPTVQKVKKDGVLSYHLQCDTEHVVVVICETEAECLN
jgi:hypothetical protein